MHDLPRVPALLALARDVLLNELMPLLPDERHADALLVAECMALAERDAEPGDEPMRAIRRDLEMLYEPLAPALSPQCGEREGPAQREPPDDRPPGRAFRGEGRDCEAQSVELSRRFACDLRSGAFENSQRRDRDARAILWRLTIARLHRSNPKFLAANGLD